MDESGYMTLHVKDMHTRHPSAPARLEQRLRRSMVVKVLLILLFLVILALLGVIVEACFIYKLYQHESAESLPYHKQIDDENFTTPTEHPSYGILPSKPVAHLTAGFNFADGKQIMAWSMYHDSLLYEMEYKDNSLIIQKEGYYYVYSKVFFLDSGIFYHSVKMHTEVYVGRSITLLQSRKDSPERESGGKEERSNSFLGGVFHLYKDDAVFVEINDATKIKIGKPYENVFGAYMI
ncbi:tumor necrosis factor ligand superfamily member 6-like [Pholidichthys leucotaenia]